MTPRGPPTRTCAASLVGTQQKYEPGKLRLGSEIRDIGLTVIQGADHVGEIQAWDMNAGKKVWTRTFESHNWGPVLATGGGLIFAGRTNDRYFRAFDAKTGDLVWQWRTNSGITGVPSSFAVDGVQYVPSSPAGASTRSGCRVLSTRSGGPRPMCRREV